MNITIVTDAWLPQVNGVVRTLRRTIEELAILGHRIEVIAPDGFRTVPCPTYPEIRLALLPGREVARRLRTSAPDAVHISTEGPLGLAARGACLREGLAFTTAYHTRFPEYVRARAPLPLSAGYAAMRWFHGPAARTLVPTPSMLRTLEDRGLGNLALWGRGVDTETFRPRGKDFLDLPRPVWLYFGRVSVEKGVEEFLRLDLPGSKLVVGDGPAAGMLQRRYPGATFAGYRHGEELASFIAASDVFVFPSRTDTFGLVLLEAMACGIPVAAYPVTGPLDVVRHGVTGMLDEDLAVAALGALELDAADCRAHAMRHSWAAATRQFVAALAPSPRYCRDAAASTAGS